MHWRLKIIWSESLENSASEATTSEILRVMGDTVKVAHVGGENGHLSETTLATLIINILSGRFYPSKKHLGS